MANPLPEEKTLYKKIKSEKISINHGIWDILYDRIGDDVTAINLICRSRLDNDEPIPAKDAKKILHYTHHIKDIVSKVTQAKKENDYFPEFLSDGPLHPDIREMFTHYIGNDVYIINLIVGNSLDPAEKEPLAGVEIQKILSHTHTIREFMDRLREATTHQKDAKGSARASGSREKLAKEAVFFKIRSHLAEEFNISEEKMHSRTRFREDMELDSVDAIRVIMVLEEAFGFEVPDEDAEKVFTVGEATDYIYKRLMKEHKK